MRIHFDTESDAFQDDREAEIIRVLQSVGQAISYGVTSGSIRDLSGNTIGFFDIANGASVSLLSTPTS